MPRILRIINRLNLGGPTFNAALLTKHLAPEFETLLVAGTRQDSEESSAFIVDELGVDFRELREMQRPIHPMKDLVAYREIRKIIREFRPDIVHTHAAKAGALGRLAAIHEKVPVVVHTFHGHVFHSYFHPAKTRIFLAIERYLGKHSDAIVAISEKQKVELTKEYAVCEPEKVKVIPLGFDLSRFRENQIGKRKRFREQYSITDDEIAIGIVGRLVPVKNHSMFIECVKRISLLSDAPLRFFIIGDGEERNHLLQLASTFGIDTVFHPEEPRKSYLTFTSWRRDVDVVMAGLDVVALTSWNEGTPVSLIEAQAAGKPIVTTNVGGIENAVLPDKTALLVQTGDIESLATNLQRIIEDAQLRNEMSRYGWEFVKERFHYTRLVSEMAELYRLLLESKAHKS